MVSLGLRFRELAAAIADRQEPALARQHAAERLEAFPKPDFEEGRLVDIAHRQRLIREEIAGIDMAVAVDRGLHVGDGTVAAAAGRARAPLAPPP